VDIFNLRVFVFRPTDIDAIPTKKESIMKLVWRVRSLVVSLLMLSLPSYCKGPRLAFVEGVGDNPAGAKHDKLNGDVNARRISDAPRCLRWSGHERWDDLTTMTFADWFNYAQTNAMTSVKKSFGGTSDSGGDYSALHTLLDKLWEKGLPEGQPWFDIYSTQKLLRLTGCIFSVRTERLQRKNPTWDGSDTLVRTETTVHLDLVTKVKHFSYGQGDGAVERIDLNGPREAFEVRETLQILAADGRTVQSEIDISPHGDTLPTSLVLSFPPNDHRDVTRASSLFLSVVDSCHRH
jgi:hypothetical protein